MKTIFTIKSMGLIAMMTVAVSIIGCKNCLDRIDANKVSDCSTYNGKREQCNRAIQKDDRKCQFDEGTAQCTATPVISNVQCETIQLEETCKAQVECVWNTVTLTCEHKK